MASYDIFNGDADGICALHQLRLAEPRDGLLITGVKRDIALVAQVKAVSGDELTVFDISLAENRTAVLAALEAGAHCLYFDHHFPGDIPEHPRFEAHIEHRPGVCTSLIVDEYLGARFRAWAVVAAFGDNLLAQAQQAAAPLGLPVDQIALLRELGECINYNAYGEALEDLYFHPAELYRRLRPYADPREFAARDPAFESLRAGYREDLAQAARIAPIVDTSDHYLVTLPDTPWARRVHGPLANRLAAAEPNRAHAVLVGRGTNYRVSVRAPLLSPSGAAELCAGFPSGGGRPEAAGINDLPVAQLPEFQRAFESAFAPTATRP
ncbi:MAG TPA: acetyltransferase [Burkholderiales bacterium]|nr:acetyltransferase [Burkholderiales bacterium]